MFGNKRRYSALPTTNANGSQSSSGGRAGGSSFQRARKYVLVAVVGGACVALLLAGRSVHKSFTHAPSVYGENEDTGGISLGYDDMEQQEALEELERLEEEDKGGFASPPFNPLGGGKGSDDPLMEDAYGRPPPYQGPIDTDEMDAEDDENTSGFHILPVPGADKHNNKGNKGGKPTSIEDFAEIDAEEQDDYDGPNSSPKQHTPSTSNNGGGEGMELANEQSNAPANFESDPDPASTTACTSDTQFDSSNPIVQYAIVIDAGSTGSRVHVYKFNNCGQSPALEYETFMSLQPGLSSYAGDPTAAAASLDPLLEEAQRVVPAHLRSCTPIEVKATAGLRLLPGKDGAAILDEVRLRLESDWPFALAKEDHAVEIMDGKDEGVYAWITANYLLGKIGRGAKTGSKDSTMAVMDLGGASTQIVFEPTFPEDSPDQLADGDHKYSLSFAGKDYTLYQHSYLGYGLMRARRSVHNLVAFTWSFLQPVGGDAGSVEWDDLSDEVGVPNPCLSKGTSRRVTLDPQGRKTVDVTMVGAESGFEACNRVVELVMAKDAVCEVKPCSFNGVYQPSLLDTFPNGQLLALSYFTDRIQPLLQPFQKSSSSANSQQTLHISTLQTMAREVCDGRSAWTKRWGAYPDAMAELEERPEYCLDLTFMHALLRLGYELDEKRELVVEKKLRGVELGWSLGAGIAMLEKSTLTCTA